MKGNFHDVPRIVKPRQPAKLTHHPLIAAHLDSRSILVERTGQVYGLEDAPDLVQAEPPSIWIIPNASWLVWELDQKLEDNPLWQFKCSPVKRDIVSVSNMANGRRTRTQETMVTFFGFQGVGKKKGYWHHPIDPVCFMAASIGQLLADNPLQGLMNWGKDIREWCAANDLNPSPTAGGLAAQLLRDPRFYPNARRKVPTATNNRARLVLPGNHYDVRTKLWRRTTGISLDMQAAHHNMAAQIQFPHADGLLARGNFKDADHTRTRIPDTPAWARANDPHFSDVLASYGLLLLRLTVPKISRDVFPPPYLSHSGQKLGWVFTNELPMLQELGVIIDGVEAAWTSYQTDPGLNAYAAWALTEIALMTPERKVWAKPTLLAAYGVLAARPRVREWAHKRGNGPTKVYPAGHGLLTVHAHVGQRETEMPTANVIQRGMIEAETRMRVLTLARELTRKKVRVLCIYADGIIVEAGTQLPLLPFPWAIKGELTNLQFVNTNAYRSDQETKLPGIARDTPARGALQNLRRNKVDIRPDVWDNPNVASNQPKE